MAKKKFSTERNWLKPNNGAKYTSMLAIINKHAAYLGYYQINVEYISTHLRKCKETSHVQVLLLRKKFCNPHAEIKMHE